VLDCTLSLLVIACSCIDISIPAPRLLFVCTGNTCRSPLAEALAEAQGVVAESAGVDAQRSDGAAPYAARALRAARDLSLDAHAPQSVDAFNLSAFDRIVALDAAVARRLRTEHAVGDERLVTWSIPDPYGGSMADYRLCLEQIDTALTRLLSE
jgi:protein-tyrosine phosphatase